MTHFNEHSPEYQDQLNDDPAALHEFQAVLQGPITGGDASTDLFLAHSHNLMLLALENSFMHGFFPFAGDNPEATLHPEVATVLEIIDTALGRLQPTDSNYHHQHFRFHLDKVMSLRNGGHYGDAIAILNNSSQWAHNYEQQQRAGYWQCVCEAEGDYYSGALPAEEYTWEKQQCQIQYAGYNFKRSSQAAINSEGYSIQNHSLSLSLYPLPATDRLQMQFSSLLDEQIELSLHSLDGQLLRQEKLHMSGNRHTFALDRLATGVYIFKVKTQTKNFNRKIVLQ